VNGRTSESEHTATVGATSVGACGPVRVSPGLESGAVRGVRVVCEAEMGSALEVPENTVSRSHVSSPRVRLVFGELVRGVDEVVIVF